MQELKKRKVADHKRILTGVKPTGDLHLGNWVGAMRPSLEQSQAKGTESFLFIADYHALTTLPPRGEIAQHTLKVAAAWLAMGLDPDKITFYRQSRVPQTFELAWILTCVTPKGLMNRAHAYKALTDKNKSKGHDDDIGIYMGLYNYPILMAADILLFQATHVPVGRDQIQHVEIARDLALKFNQSYGNVFTLPQSDLKNTPTLQGLDGQKMSKSYHNTIPLFAAPDVLKKLIFKIKTNSLPPDAPKDPDDCTLFSMYAAIASGEEKETLEARYQEGIGWGDVKTLVFEKWNTFLTPYRETYEKFLAQPDRVESILQSGEKRAQDDAAHNLEHIKQALGFSKIS